MDSYGIARYREVNPSVFTIVTFPFLFAVMFGDVGHAALMLIMAVYLVLNERKLSKQNLGDMFDMIFGGAYLLRAGFAYMKWGASSCEPVLLLVEDTAVPCYALLRPDRNPGQVTQLQSATSHNQILV